MPESELAALEAFFLAVVWTLVTELPGRRTNSPIQSNRRGIDVDYLIAATRHSAHHQYCATSRCSPDLQPPLSLPGASALVGDELFDELDDALLAGGYVHSSR